MGRLCWWGVVVVWLGPMALSAAQDDWTTEQLNFFESKIRPILVEHCYSCHSEESGQISGGLRVDNRAGILQGGDSGAAIEPGSPDDSLLLMAIRHEDDELAMPPSKEGGKLPDHVIADFEAWIRMGAPDPRKAERIAPEFGADEEAKNWWAFQPIQRPDVPKPMDAEWCRSDIDRFVRVKLEQNGLQPVGDAEPLALIRRVHFDLVGLPPLPEDAQRFADQWNNASDEASRDELLAAEVDRLLISPQFGERWGRHWLDVARYSESSGKDVNVLYPWAWRYRDYVIDALNADMTFDEFLRQQVAGDLLNSVSDEDRARNLTATGFLAIGPKSLNEMRARQFVVDLADEQIDTVSQSFMGLTVACARCHDHKFDPISQEDYTAFLGIFLSTDTRYGTSGGNGGRNAGSLLELPVSTASNALPALSAAEVREMQSRIEALQTEQREYAAERMRARRRGETLPNDGFNIVRITTQLAQLQADLRNYNPDGSVKSIAVGAVDKPRRSQESSNRRNRTRRNARGGFDVLADSPLFVRGDVDRPSDTIKRSIPNILDSVGPLEIPATASGRLQLAQWMTDSDHPLTSRVIVNRVWHWIFGAGIVSSVDNFGTTGTLPSHPELLDHLAAQFQEDGWSIKSLIREIVLSRTYRLATTYNETNYAADSSNALLWRHNPKRLEAEAIRDAMLASSGMLDLNRPTGSLIGSAGDGLVGGPRRAALSEDRVAKASNNHRSVYLSIARNVEPEVLSVFDFPDASTVQGSRQITNVPSQSLFLLNSDFAAQQALALANRVTPVSEKLDDSPRLNSNAISDRVTKMYWLSVGRPPTDPEIAAAKKLLSRYRNDPMAGWTSVARALLASAEFRSID